MTFSSHPEPSIYAHTKEMLGIGTDGYASYQAHAYQNEKFREDPYSATRRAIVRAAAAIGKEMK